MFINTVQMYSNAVHSRERPSVADEPDSTEAAAADRAGFEKEAAAGASAAEKGEP